MSETTSTDGGGGQQTHTIRLELADEPGELLRALEPVASHGGNLLSIYHERGSLTPRGQIPVEIDLECTPGQFDAIVDSLSGAGVNVVEADADRYDESVTLVLVGDVLEADLADTLERIEGAASASVTDVALTAPVGTDGASSARVRLRAPRDSVAATLSAIQAVADDKGLRVIEPLLTGEV